MNFKEQYISGACGIDYLDECIEGWHADLENTQSLHAYLGLSEKEYAVFLKGGNIEELLSPNPS